MIFTSQLWTCRLLDRLTVDLILAKLGSGESIEALLESHPRVRREGVLAAVRYAAQALRAGFAEWARLPKVAELDGVKRDLLILGRHVP